MREGGYYPQEFPGDTGLGAPGAYHPFRNNPSDRIANLLLESGPGPALTMQRSLHGYRDHIGLRPPVDCSPFHTITGYHRITITTRNLDLIPVTRLSLRSQAFVILH